MLRGWIELSSSNRPGWHAICYGWEEVEAALAAGPKLALYRAVVRGPVVGDEAPIIAIYTAARGPVSGQLAIVRDFPVRRPTK
jgi:hypothetical protein